MTDPLRKQKETAFQIYLHGLRCAETISRIVGVSPETVRFWIHRGGWATMPTMPVKTRRVSSLPSRRSVAGM